ncbi:phosphoribosyltransferase [Aestuariirhabdus sp. Z084]|uniref:phosphoribosyltransferase n=1 Tax=Aestuariirhabdus haliotis TaxID=2918751 RepID=UPI0020BEDB65|nr:phosphoribosyltransferase [Aestuariirhabdus haliotis]MCL6417882.1 phosphoribosyltransferase [Aestuariirhabdus haliotis]
MGIDISGTREISINESHDHRLVTCPSKNPKISKINGLKISSIYRRTKTGDFARDGNPFIYALKQKSGYSISKHELAKFSPSFYSILEKVLEDQSADFVVPMPSTHNIATILARRVARNCGGELITDFMLKQTIGSVLEQFDLSAVHPKHKKEVKAQLATYRKLPPHAQISLKKVPNKIRQYFSPVIINSNYNDLGRKGKVILVDDLLSTGTTLSAAKKLVVEYGGDCDMAVCLLSDL